MTINKPLGRPLRIRFILPSNTRGFLGQVSRSGIAGFPRLALSTLAALTPPEHEVSITDCRNMSIDYREPIDIAAITSLTPEAPHAYEIADRYRANGVTVVMGGVHCSALPDEALRHADVVITGEAERTWPKFLLDYQEGNHKSLYSEKERFALEAMPTPRRFLYDERKFSNFYTMQATRGCPFDCHYCSVTTFFGKSFRCRPVDEVVREIVEMKTKRFFFVDDNLIGNRKYAKELMRALIPLNISWSAQVSLNMADDSELLELYAKSGGDFAFIGIESINSDSLADANKSWNDKNGYGNKLAQVRKAGINILGSFVFGFDSDRPSIFRRTLEFVKDHKIDACYYNILTPYPGTVMFDKMKKEGRIVDRDWSKYHSGEAVVEPANMSRKQLQDGYYWIYRETYKAQSILKRLLFTNGSLVSKVGINFSYRRKAMKLPVAAAVTP